MCGCAIDFLYETTLGVTFTMELRPASPLGGGFILPPDQIVPTGEENMAGACTAAVVPAMPAISPNRLALAGFITYAERLLAGLKDGSWTPRNATRA